MCGLLGLLTSGADADRRAGPVGRRAALRAAPRAGRERHLARRGRRLRLQPAVDHRRRALAPAARWVRRADGRYAIVFNGEIYNYLELRDELAREHGATFATEGDTEAIVAAYHHWGPPRSPGCAGCSPS